MSRWQRVIIAWTRAGLTAIGFMLIRETLAFPWGWTYPWDPAVCVIATVSIFAIAYWQLGTGDGLVRGAASWLIGTAVTLTTMIALCAAGWTFLAWRQGVVDWFLAVGVFALIFVLVVEVLALAPAAVVAGLVSGALFSQVRRMPAKAGIAVGVTIALISAILPISTAVERAMTGHGLVDTPKNSGKPSTGQ